MTLWNGYYACFRAKLLGCRVPKKERERTILPN
jgi:hypothetical protein